MSSFYQNYSWFFQVISNCQPTAQNNKIKRKTAEKHFSMVHCPPEGSDELITSVAVKQFKQVLLLTMTHTDRHSFRTWFVHVSQSRRSAK